MKGPLPVSLRGCKYVVTVIDEASSMRSVGSIRAKSDVAGIALWETQVHAPGRQWHRIHG